MSRETISKITDAVLTEMTDSSNRLLNRVYPAAFIDAILVKVRNGHPFLGYSPEIRRVISSHEHSLSDLPVGLKQEHPSRMSRRAVVTCGVLAAAIVLAPMGCGGDDVLSLTDAQTGSEVLLDRGDRLELRLESNPSTGYRWVTAPGEVDAVLALISEVYEEPNSDLVGAAGTQVFEYEATSEGAGILRLDYLRPFEDPAIPERVVEYIVRIDDAPWPPVTTGDPPTTGTATAPESTTSTTSQPEPDVIDVEALFDGEGPRKAVVRGFLLSEDGGTRLCSVLMESYPPQCGWAWVVVPNSEGLDYQFDQTQGVRWTPSFVDVPGTFDGIRFIADGGRPDVTVTEDDVALVEAFWEYSSTRRGFAEIPLADEVGLGIGSEIDRTVAASELANPAAWDIDVDEYQGFAGPFSALDLQAENYDILVGTHPRCAGPPVPAPEGLEDHRRVSIQPRDTTSCIEWWTIDFFVADDGRIDAVTLDLFGP